MDPVDFNWRIVIHQSRYGGVYEGGQWFAVFCGDEFPEEAISDDVTCADFWGSAMGKLCGVGDTPNEALENLFRNNGEARAIYGKLHSTYIPESDDGSQDRDDT